VHTVDVNTADEASTSVRLAELLAAIAEGDRAAFDEFYARTGPRVYWLATRIVRDPTMAEEISQEVFLQVWTTAGRYDRTQGSPLGWLTTLAHRRSVDRVRVEQAARDRAWAYAGSHLGRDHDSVAERVEQVFDEQAVLRCLDTLTPAQREAIGLAYYGGRTYSQVAEHLNSPLPTIKSRIRDGLIRLKNCLGANADV
jgi:RNA polymerase sigma-70 factor, ECF subfamily